MKTQLETIKTWFETGDIPTEEQFHNTFDSFHHKDNGEIIVSKSIADNGDVSFRFSDGQEITIKKFIPELPNPIEYINNLLNNLEQTSAFVNVQNAEDAVDEKVDVSRSGKTGFGTPTPKSSVDVVGDFKGSWEDKSGLKAILHAGDLGLNDLGLPQGMVKGVLGEVRSHPDLPTLQGYMFTGDSALTSFKMISGSGIRDLTPNALQETRVISFSSNENPKELYSQMRSINEQGDYASLSTKNGIDETGPTLEMIITHQGSINSLLLDHNSIQVDKAFILKKYGVKGPSGDYSYMKGFVYDKENNLSIGEPTRILAIDENGVGQTIAIGEKTIKMEVSSKDIQNLFANEISILPAPGEGNITIIKSAVVNYTAGTTPYNEDIDLLLKQGDRNTMFISASDLADISSTITRVTPPEDVRYEENKETVLSASNDLGTRGDGNFILYITYEIFTL